MPTSKLIRRLGSKDYDIKHFSSYFPNFDEIDVIVEPFAGSFAVSKYIMKTFKKDFKYHINDNDPIMNMFYNSYDDCLKMFDTINIKKLELGLIADGHHFIDKNNILKLREFINIFTENQLLKEYIFREVFLRGYIVKIPNIDKLCPIEKKITDIATKTDYDYKQVFELYRNSDKAFLFLDPPYMFSDNRTYAKQSTDNGKDNTNMIIDFLDFFKTCKCKVMLVINKLHILEWLFRDFKKSEYEKIYSIGKRKDKHLIITNY